MKKLRILTLFVLAAFAYSCSDDENSLNDVNGSAPAGNITALFTITQDNTGLVTITPNAEGAVKFEVFHGDGLELPSTLTPGQSTDHIYKEGNYDVRIVAYDVTGKKTEAIQQLTVAFRAPENLVIKATAVAGSSFSLDVTATADYETYFEVYFGESEGESPVQFNEGQTVNHVYEAPGTYTIRVVAFSGGAATAEATQEVTILDPLTLPLTFESSTLAYTFGDFGGSATSVIDNPDASGINTSTKVVQHQKNPGEVWAGTAIQLDGALDFQTYKSVTMKVWSPAANVPVILKVENAADSTISFENQQMTTTANAWETMTFNFTAIDASKEYSKVVLFFNFGTSGTGENYYFDDINLAVAPLWIDFESATTLNSFGNAGAALIANPDVSGINMSANVASLFKPNGAEVWAGVAIPQSSPIDFSVQKKIRMKVWSPQAGIPVLLKIEKNNDNQVFMEKTMNTTVANAWEELTFDYEDVIDSSIDYQMVVVFFNFGTGGDGSTYYFDDIIQSN